MNGAEITRVRSPLSENFKVKPTGETASIPPTQKAETADTELSGETEAGLDRFANFLKIATEAKDRRRSRGLRAYDRQILVSEEFAAGQLFDRAA